MFSEYVVPLIYFFNDTYSGTNFAYAPAIQLKNINLNIIFSNIQTYENIIFNAYGPSIWLIGGDKTTLAKDITIRNILITKHGLMRASTRIEVFVALFVMDIQILA